jgi:hypothetical protein
MADTEVDPFDEPGAKGSGAFPGVAQLKGRLVIIKPLNLEKHVPGVEAGKFVDRITADVHVLDGEPITAALDKDGDIKAEFDEPLVPAFVLESMYLSQTVLVNQLRAAYKNDGIVLGRIGQDPARKKGQNKAWVLETANDADKATAREYWTTYLAEQKNKDPWD